MWVIEPLEQYKYNDRHNDSVPFILAAKISDSLSFFFKLQMQNSTGDTSSNISTKECLLDNHDWTQYRRETKDSSCIYLDVFFYKLIALNCELHIDNYWTLSGSASRIGTHHKSHLIQVRFIIIMSNTIATWGTCFLFKSRRNEYTQF